MKQDRGGEQHHLGYSAVWSVEIQLTFQSKSSPQPSVPNNEPSKNPAYNQAEDAGVDRNWSLHFYVSGHLSFLSPHLKLN
jgi:hypothetical protein